MINKNSHYFTLMRPLHFVPIIGWAFTESTDKEQWVECEIVEDRYKIEDGYKVTLKAVKEGFGQETLYQSTFESCLRTGRIIEKTKESQHEEKLVWYEPLTDSVNIRCEASVLVD